jgi:hypothetical protein
MMYGQQNFKKKSSIALWPIFGPQGLPEFLPPNIYLPSCRRPVPYLGQIHGIATAA